jgi:hypothetical protein
VKFDAGGYAYGSKRLPGVDAHSMFERPSQVAPRPFEGHTGSGQILFHLAPRSIALVELG